MLHPILSRLRQRFVRTGFAILVASLTALGASSANAQKTIIVDAGNGAGTNFTRLQPAIDSASAGDRILVRPGSYDAPTIQKGITIHALFGGAKIVTRTKTMRVTGIPAGQKCVLAGFIFDGTFAIIEKCRGVVAISGFAIAAGFSPLPTLNITDCNLVTMHGCALKSSILCYRSRLWMSDSFLVPTQTGTGLVGTGIVVTDGELDVTNCIIRGGDKAGNFPASRAITAAGKTTLRIRGDKKTEISGGLNGTTRTASIAGSSASTIEDDPRVTTQGAITGFSVRSTRKQVGLAAGYSFLTATTELRLHGRQGEIGALFLGLYNRPILWPGVGEWWLDKSAEIFLGAGFFGANETITIRLQQLSTPALRGLEIGYQGVLITPQLTMEFTRPVLQVLR